jgi:hypothetical protein
MLFNGFPSTRHGNTHRFLDCVNLSQRIVSVRAIGLQRSAYVDRYVTTDNV